MAVDILASTLHLGIIATEPAAALELATSLFGPAHAKQRRTSTASLPGSGWLQQYYAYGAVVVTVVPTTVIAQSTETEPVSWVHLEAQDVVLLLGTWPTDPADWVPELLHQLQLQSPPALCLAGVPADYAGRPQQNAIRATRAFLATQPPLHPAHRVFLLNLRADPQRQWPVHGLDHLWEHIKNQAPQAVAQTETAVKAAQRQQRVEAAITAVNDLRNLAWDRISQLRERNPFKSGD